MLTRAPSPLLPSVEDLVTRVIGCCLEVHSALGPGLTEVVYTSAVCVELGTKNIAFEREKALPVEYRGQLLCHHRVDVLVENQLVLEVKSVERLHPVHVAQTVGYLRLTGAKVGLIVNFNTERLRYGIRRVVL